VRPIPEVAKDPHLWEREMLVKKDDAIAGEMYLPGATIKLSKIPACVGEVPTPASTPTRCWAACSTTTAPPSTRFGRLGRSRSPPAAGAS
jgi:crotonobetainyl-CoA:carnitine CoA-transferase CaiB-like acyl-CoA transferase